MAGTRNGGGLNYQVTIDIVKAKRDAADMKKAFDDLRKAGTGTFDSKPLSEYQAAQLKIKQDSLELAKAKQEQARADKSASLALQEALKQERLAREEILTQIQKNKLALQEQIAIEKAAKAQASVKKPTTISNSQSEIDTYAASTKGSMLYTSAVNAETVARARLNSTAAVQAISEGTLRTEQVFGVQATRQSTEANKSNLLTKIQAVKLLAEEKYIQAQATKELKNNIREQLNAKGSLEQRRAALIRLQTAYDRLAPLERATPSGQRLDGIVGRVSEQVKVLEMGTGRAGRNVGFYTSAMAKGFSNVYSKIKLVANILPGLGLSGVLLLVLAPLALLLEKLNIFKSTLEKLSAPQKAINASYQESAGLIAKEAGETTLLIGKINDKNRSMSERQTLLNDFIGKNPAVLGALTLQNVATEKGTGIINDYIAALRRKIEMQSLEKGYSDALEKRADIDSGKEDTGLGWLGKSLITANKVLAGFKGESIGEAIDKANARFKNQALIAQDAVVKGYEDKLKATVAGEAKIVKVQDTSLSAAEAKLSQVNERLRTLQQGESDKTLKQQKAQLEKEIKARTEALGLTTVASRDSAAKAQETAVKRQRVLQAEIDTLTKKGVASKLDADKQEIINVEEKYKKLREKAIAFNNAKDSKGQKVNISGLNAAETAKKTEIVNKKSANDLKVSLDEQAKYYTEFEDLKSKIGEEKAKERYSKLINTDKTYYEKLKELQDVASKPTNGKGANPFAMKLLAESVNAEKLVQQKNYDDLVTQFMSYADKRKKLTNEFNETMAALANDPSAQAEKKEAYEAELGNLDDANAKKLDSFEQLFKGVDRLSDENARKVISNAEVMLNSLLSSGKISKELASQIRELLGNTKKEVSDRMPERIINLANQIDRVADAVGEVDEGFGKMLHTVGNVVGQVGNIKKGLGDLKLAQGKGDTLSQLSAGLGIFGAGMSIVSGIAKLFDRSAQREAQQGYSRDLQNKQIEAINAALERQVALINDAYGTDRLVKYSEALRQASENQVKYQQQLSGRYSKTGNVVLDKQIALFNAGDKGALGFIKNLKDLDKFKLPTGFEDLQNLLESDLLDEGTKVIVTNLIQAAKTAKELENNLKSETIGSSLDSIADSFIKNLTDGTQDFGKTFEDVIRTSILNGFKGQIIKEQLQGFYDDFAVATKDGSLTPDEIEALRKSYLAASEKAKKDFEDLEKATGISLTDSASSSTKSGGITAEISTKITQDQASELTGLFRAQYDITKQSNGQLISLNKTSFDAFAIAKSHFDVAIQTAANTLRTADNTERLAGMESSLKTIASNTTSQSSRSLTG
jgi:hypothetical protein